MTAKAPILLQRFVKDRGAARLAITLATSGGITGWDAIGTPLGSAAGFAYKRGVPWIGAYRETISNLSIALGASVMPPSLTTLGRDFFAKVIAEDAGGTPVEFLTGTAVYSTQFTSGLFYGLWRWGDGSSPLWTTADDGEVKLVTLY